MPITKSAKKALKQSIVKRARNNVWKKRYKFAIKKANKAIEEKSKITDTDNDGLFDWDELNKYNTSPYLNDSDSDGIDDGIEVKNSTDPNCAQGRDCSLSGYLVSGASSTVSSVPQASASETEIIKANAEILRQALLDSKSVDKETLDKISDEDLLTIYQLAAEEAASSTEQ